MNIERLMNEFDDEGIKNNYNEWIKVISDVYINNKGGEISLNKFQYNYLLSKLVEVINEKLHSDIELNMMEVEVFLHSIICYVLDELYIKSLKWYEYMEPDGEILKDDTWNGACKRTIDESFVYYNMKILKKIGNKDIRLDERLIYLLTIPHELVHVKQMEDMLEGIITLDNYIMTLERVLKLENFYFDNYAYVREEIDANNRAVDLLFDYYKKYHIYDKRMVNELKKCMKLVNDYRINSANNHNVIIDGVEKDIPLEYYSLYKSSEYVKKELEFIKYYPLLKLVYNDDGSLYSIKELFVKRRSMLNDGINISELNKIYEHILVSYQVFMDMDSILNEIKIYLDSVNHDDVFALFMLEVITEPKVIITKEDLEDKIQKRILKFRERNKS